MCSQYTVSLAEFDDMPLAKAFALYAAILTRKSQLNGPSYEAMETIDELIREGLKP